MFAGKRVSASVNKGQELPQDFGQASSIVDHGMIDGAFESRMEIREKITNLIRVLLKKSEIEMKKLSQRLMSRLIYQRLANHKLFNKSVKFGLKRINLALKLLGNPERKLNNVISVLGESGKFTTLWSLKIL